MQSRSSFLGKSEVKLPANIQERLLDKYSPEPNSGCWPWTAALNNMGYGVINFMVEGKPRLFLAHRLLYTLHKGRIPKGLELDHLCRVSSCVNPQHLEAVTHRENIRRGHHNSFNLNKTHCLRGHPFSAENIYPVAGGRSCRTCRKEWAYKFRRRNGMRIRQLRRERT